jgi:hypothetical protein
MVLAAATVKAGRMPIGAESAPTMTEAGVIAKLLATIHTIGGDDLDDFDNSYEAVLASAAHDAHALANGPQEEGSS